MVAGPRVLPASAPVRVAAEIVVAVPPVLLTVNVIGEPDVPIVTVPKSRWVGPSASAGCAPVPLRIS